ncbi:MAG: IPT/TIG domain-containing protein [Bdellovibrionales bacterium]|nr:IPT/TIG domain-containing protein [Bdellovibrionales bacterium]
MMQQRWNGWRVWSVFGALSAGSLMIAGAGCVGGDPEGFFVDDIQPASGPTYGGTRVNIIGQNFVEGVTIRIGDADCVDLVVVSDAEIECTTTNAAEGVYDVVAQLPIVDSAEDTATLPSGFTYTCVSAPTPGVQVWANEGGEKITKDDARATCDPSGLVNSAWDGTKVKLFGAKNEVVNFQLLVEAAVNDVNNVTVDFDTLSGPGGSTIGSVNATGNQVFDWTQRNIEMFYVKYLQIKGLSVTGYHTDDQRHVPQRFRTEYFGEGFSNGTWEQRPDHDKFYPEIAVPLELENGFDVANGDSQAIWVDVYIPKTAAVGTYTGTIEISENGSLVKSVPVELKVRNITLPDAPTSKTMVYMGYGPMNARYMGDADPNDVGTNAAQVKTIRDRHFMMAHRHKISLVDDNNGVTPWNQDAPRPEWQARLNGSLFSAANGYAGPGANTSNGIYAIGTYGTWSWRDTGDEATMHAKTDAWESWFQTNAPGVERLLFLGEGSGQEAQIETWAQWMASNPGVGQNIKSFATIDLLQALAQTPSLDISATYFKLGDTATWQAAMDSVTASAQLQAYMLNAKRPAVGSFVTEDDGVSPRMIPWAQYKKKVDRWFYWESAYYSDFQSGRGANNLFNEALTLGLDSAFDPIRGRNGYRYSNGDGVLFYPGTDLVNSADSYGLAGPIASLRMKYWRRGIQDADYLALANAVNPTRTQQVLQARVPKALWDYGVTNPADPTYVRADISWSIKPDDWEAARKELADIIEGL